ncbi:MAG: SDR family NAD(P)-dependent oxidoreductase, partial [Muribaculaceae bacterium]|nr:SDR family NAD(P)-dependent oxidoreductase [Muribaculaceae bacterium]
MSFALITGASSGIGLAYADALAQLGCNILIVSNKEDANIAAASKLTESYNIQAIPLNIDLSTSDAAEKIYEYCISNSIEIDTLICNAGILLFSKLINTEIS